MLGSSFASAAETRGNLDKNDKSPRPNAAPAAVAVFKNRLRVESESMTSECTQISPTRLAAARPDHFALNDFAFRCRFAPFNSFDLFNSSGCGFAALRSLRLHPLRPGCGLPALCLRGSPLFLPPSSPAKIICSVSAPRGFLLMKQMVETQQFLADYAENGSEAAFRELFARYLNLVYSTALRLMDRNVQSAEDVTQMVFVHLSRHARKQQAAFMNSLTDHSEANFKTIAPVLDEAINLLGAEDRAAILLRFFERRDFRAVGAALGSNEDAARMRVNRALEKLRSLLHRRGVT